MNILSALKKVTTSIKTWVDGKLENKLDKNLGENNSGKVLAVGNNGDVEPQLLDTGIVVLSGTDDNPINIDEIKTSGTYLIKGTVTTSMDTTSGSDSAKLNKIFMDGFACGELMSVYSLQDGFINQFMMNPTRPLVRLDSGEGYSDAIDVSYIQPVEKTAEMTQPVGMRRDGQLFTKPFSQVQSDWNQNDNTASDYIKNKPDIKQIELSDGIINIWEYESGIYVFTAPTSYLFKIMAKTGDEESDVKQISGIMNNLSYSKIVLAIMNACTSKEASQKYELNIIVDSSVRLYTNIHNSSGWTYSSICTPTVNSTNHEYKPNMFLCNDGGATTGIWKEIVIDTELSDSSENSVQNKVINTAINNLKPKSTTVTMLAADWIGDAEPFSQVVSINGVTTNSKIDLQPTPVQLVELKNNEITLVVLNDNGTVTAYALGSKPTKDYTMQVSITEMMVT